MPFDKTPSVSTFQTKRLKLITEMNTRGSVPTIDTFYLNCFSEYTKNKVTQEQEIRLRKRSGSQSTITLSNSLTRGVHHWEDMNMLFVAQGHNIYVYEMGTDTLVTTLVNIFPTTSGGDVGFCEFLYDTGVVKLVVTDGITLSTVDDTYTVVACADADLPQHVPQPVYMDGYLFIVKDNTSDLYNSNLNDPLAYTPGDFISSELLADKVVGVLRLNNYIVLFGSDSVEYFWDAANTSGSPLQRNDTPVKLVGYKGGLAQLGNKIYFIGDNDHSQPSVYILEDFKITPSGNEPMRRFLTVNSDQILQANIVSIDGHDFYLIWTTEYSFAMEMETGLWHRWGWKNLDYFDMQFCLTINTGLFYRSIFIRYGIAKVYEFLPTLYQDDGIAITTKWQLDNEEFDSMNQKYMSNLCIWADRTSSGTNNVLVQWSDDDFLTFNTGVTVDLNQEYPGFRRLGRFRRRAFKFTHTENQPLRIKAIESDINMGIS